MILLADENIPLVTDFFASLGSVVTRPGRTMASADAKDASALLVRSVTRVNKTLLDNTKVSFVGTCTIGVDHLDQAWLKRKGIEFASAPGCNANSVVEYVYAALCQLNVNWLGKTFGIIGCGNVGGLLHKRLKQQGVDCYCYDPKLSIQQNPDLTSLEQVLACDIISMHTPLTQLDEHPTFHLIGSAQLQQLKQGAVLLNCGRGPVINNAELLQFLRSRDDVQVVLDVWEPEPNINLELLERVALATPHIAGYSYDGKLKGTEMIYRALCNHLQQPATLSLAQLVPPLSDNRLRAPQGVATWSQIKHLVAQVYAIGEDDRRLRALALDERTHRGNFAEGFDELRKYYPTRREFQNYQIDASSLADAAARQWLSALGFSIQ